MEETRFTQGDLEELRRMLESEDEESIALAFNMIENRAHVYTDNFEDFSSFLYYNVLMLFTPFWNDRNEFLKALYRVNEPLWKSVYLVNSTIANS
jgi:hypothetical protein